MRREVKAAVEAAAYFVIPASEMEAIPEHRGPREEPVYDLREPLPGGIHGQGYIPPAPPPMMQGRPRTSAHPRAEYWREYKRMRYHSDPAFRQRILERERQKRGAR